MSDSLTATLLSFHLYPSIERPTRQPVFPTDLQISPNAEPPLRFLTHCPSQPLSEQVRGTNDVLCGDCNDVGPEFVLSFSYSVTTAPRLLMVWLVKP